MIMTLHRVRVYICDSMRVKGELKLLEQVQIWKYMAELLFTLAQSEACNGDTPHPST